MSECACAEFAEARSRVLAALDPVLPIKTNADRIAREVSAFGVHVSPRRIKCVVYEEISKLWQAEAEAIRAWSEARAIRRASQDAALLRQIQEAKAEARRALERAEEIERAILGREALASHRVEAGQAGRLDVRPGREGDAPQEAVARRASGGRR